IEGGVGVRESMEIPARQRIGPRVGEGHRVGTPGAAIEHGDLAKEVATHDVPDAELTPFARRHRQANAALRYKIEICAVAAARKNRLVARKAHLAKRPRTFLKHIVAQPAEQPAALEERNEFVISGHGNLE